MCSSILSASMFVHHMHVWYLQCPEKSIRSLENGVRNSCELPGVFWDSTPGPLKEQQTLLNIEPYL